MEFGAGSGASMEGDGKYTGFLPRLPSESGLLRVILVLLTLTRTNSALALSSSVVKGPGVAMWSGTG
jgi:hypothetical protein